MTLVARPNLAFGGPLSLSLILYDLNNNPVTAAVEGRFFADGGIQRLGNNTSGNDYWYFPTETGVGNNYWIKFELLSGAPWDTGLVAGTLYQLSSTRSLRWSASGSSVIKEAEVRVSLYRDAAGTQPVYTDGAILVTVDPL